MFNVPYYYRFCKLLAASPGSPPPDPGTGGPGETGNPSPAPQLVNVIAFGDSLMNETAKAMRTSLNSSDPGIYTVNSNSYAGETPESTRKYVKHVLEQQYDQTKRNIFVLDLGTNNLVNASSWLQLTINEAVLKGCQVIQIIPGWPNYPNTSGSGNYTAFRTDIITNWQSRNISAIYDLYLTEVGAADADSVQYYTDNIHYTAAGYTIRGGYYASWVKQFVAAGARPIPTTPTVSEDAAGRTMTLTLPSGYTAADLQFSENFGLTVQDWTGGSAAISTTYRMLQGQFAVRLKAKGSNGPSAWVFNGIAWAGAEKASEFIARYDPRITSTGWIKVTDNWYATGAGAKITLTGAVTKGVRVAHVAGKTESAYQGKITSASNPTGVTVAQQTRPTDAVNGTYNTFDYYDSASSELKTLEFSTITGGTGYGWFLGITVYQ